MRTVHLLLLAATLAACTRGEPEDTSDRIERQAQLDQELSQIRVNPADCPGGDDAMVYVDLGDAVVRVPYSKDHPVIRGLVYAGADELPAPPMPDALEGCKEHPAPAQALHLSSLQLETIAQSQGDSAAPLTAISLFWTRTGRSPNQESNEQQFDSMRAQGKCTHSPSGLTICGRREDDSPVSTGVQVAGGDVAGGSRWVAVCGQGPSILVDDCTVYYQPRKGMVARYRFNQQQVSLERMFELDPRVRRWLNSIVVERPPR